MGRLAVLLSVTLASALALAQGSIDLPVLSVLKQSDRSLSELRVWHRAQVSNELDLVLAIGTQKDWPLGDREMWWAERRKLGLFLQDRNEPGRVFSLAIEEGPHAECSARILRATETDTVISCDGEMSERFPNHKFVYDVRAKRLVSHFTYEPFQMYRADARAGAARAVFVGTNGARRVDVEFGPRRSPAFRIRASNTETEQVGDQPYLQLPPPRRPPSRPFGPSRAFTVLEGVGIHQSVGTGRIYRLPQSDLKTYAKARPEDAAYSLDVRLGGEELGPWKLEGNRLWFGKTFYGGEGSSGVGAIGYFDATTSQYRLFSDSAIASCSVSAIEVQNDSVWAALVHHGEYGDAGCGVVRFDRQSEAFEEFRMRGLGREFLQVDRQLLLASDRGIAVIDGKTVQEYFVDRTTDGRLRVVASN